MFRRAAYNNMIGMHALLLLLFRGGWFPVFSGSLVIPMAFVFAVKTKPVCFGFVLVKATFSRYHYDQLMDIAGKVFLLFILDYFVFIGGSFFLPLKILQINAYALNTYSDYGIQPEYNDDTISS